MLDWNPEGIAILVVLIVIGLNGVAAFIVNRHYDRPPDEQELARMKEMLEQRRRELEEQEKQKNQENQPKT